MPRAEVTTRLVLEVHHDAADGAPVRVGDDTSLVLGSWLIGAEGKVADVGPALGFGERERGPFLEALERSIGCLAELLGAEPRFGPAIGAPRRGARDRDLHYQNHGRLAGLCEAYLLLTGKPQATAIERGLEAWRRHCAATAPELVR